MAEVCLNARQCILACLKSTQSISCIWKPKQELDRSSAGLDAHCGADLNSLLGLAVILLLPYLDPKQASNATAAQCVAVLLHSPDQTQSPASGTCFGRAVCNRS